MSIPGPIRDPGDHRLGRVFDDRRLEWFRAVVNRIEDQVLLARAPTPRTEHRADVRTVHASVSVQIGGSTSLPPLRKQESDVASTHLAGAVEIRRAVGVDQRTERCEQRQRGDAGSKAVHSTRDSLEGSLI